MLSERLGVRSSPDIYGTIYCVSSNMVHADCQTLEFFSKEDQKSQSYEKNNNDHALSSHCSGLHGLSCKSKNDSIRH